MEKSSKKKISKIFDSRIKRFLAFFSLFTLLPALVAGVYYFFIASDIYVSKSKFSLYKEESSMGENPLLASMGGASQLTDLLVIEEFIKSKELLFKLQNLIDLKKIYNSKDASILDTIASDATDEEFLQYFLNMIKIEIYREASIVILKTKAYSAREAQIINEQIIELTEGFINNSLVKVRNASIENARVIVSQAEEEIKNAQNEIENFREKNGNFNPTEEIKGAFTIIQNLETRKAELNADLASKKGFLSNNASEVKMAKSQIKSLSNEIQKLRNKTLKGDSSLNEITKKFEILMLENEFARKRYEISIMNLESVIKEASFNDKFVINIVNPTLPDIATEPERFWKFLTALLMAFMITSILALIYSSIMDHLVI